MEDRNAQDHSCLFDRGFMASCGSGLRFPSAQREAVGPLVELFLRFTQKLMPLVGLCEYPGAVAYIIPDGCVFGHELETYISVPGVAVSHEYGELHMVSR